MGRGGIGAWAWVIFGLRKRKNRNRDACSKKEIEFFIDLVKL
jgi:hypothetical protein